MVPAARLAPILFLVLLLSACTMWDKPKTTTWANATGAEQFERLMWQEIKAANWTEVEKRLAPTFVVSSPGGLRDRAAEMAFLRRLAVKDYALGEVEVRPNGNDMVVTYTITLDATLDGQPMPSGPWRVLTVWQQVDTTWSAIVQSHALDEPPPSSQK
ncbi:MAG: nuclear transport factor 2 family protein [Terriglobales bacterium]